MRRTTAGINFFRIVNPDPSGNGDGKHANDEKWSVVADEETQKSADVLKQIEASNRELREAKRIEEKYFNIELEEPLCAMRNDTSLVIVDVPGINEADSDSIYIRYVEDNWTLSGIERFVSSEKRLYKCMPVLRDVPFPAKKQRTEESGGSQVSKIVT